jgi:hypothetical protein
MPSETELEVKAIENAASCNSGQCPDGYQQWCCPMEERNMCIDVEKEHWLAVFDDIGTWIDCIRP